MFIHTGLNLLLIILCVLIEPDGILSTIVQPSDKSFGLCTTFKTHRVSDTELGASIVHEAELGFSADCDPEAFAEIVGQCRVRHPESRT